MAQIIRQEINILDALLSAAGGATADSNEIVQLNTTQYNGATYYFEIVADSTVSISFNVKLLSTTGAGLQATCNVPLLTTAYTLIRSSSFTPSNAVDGYAIQIDNTAGATKNVKAARIVIIQNATTLTNTETQIEVGSASTTTSLTSVPLTNPKYWKYTAANWDGTKSFYFEATFKNGTTKSAATASLQVADGTGDGFAGWADVASSPVTTTSTTPARVRSAAITLTDGRWYRVAIKSSSTKETATIYNAKVIVDQIGSTVATYYFDASDAGPIDNDGVWTNDANAFDGSTATAATTTQTSGTETLEELRAAGTNAPASGDGIGKVRMRYYGGGSGNINVKVYTDGEAETLGTINELSPADPNYSNYITLSVPSGGWTWATIQALEVIFWEATGAAGTKAIRVVELEVTSGNITKLEPQYLLANTLFAAGTALQTFLTKWDSTEWDAGGGTITYYFQAEAANGSTSDVELWEADGGGSGLGVLTNIDNAQISSAVTMPTSQNMDTKATTNAGDVAAARILVAYVFSAAVAAFIAQKPLVINQAINKSNTY